MRGCRHAERECAQRPAGAGIAPLRAAAVGASFFLYIGVSSGHRCTRSDCDVCEHLMFLSLLLRGAVLLSGAVSVFSKVTDQSSKGFQGISGWVCSRTPVACKVRLNN